MTRVSDEPTKCPDCGLAYAQGFDALGAEICWGCVVEDLRRKLAASRTVLALAEARVERLRKALKPFADHYIWRESWHDVDPEYLVEELVRVGDYRAAAKEVSGG